MALSATVCCKSSMFSTMDLEVCGQSENDAVTGSAYRWSRLRRHPLLGLARRRGKRESDEGKERVTLESDDDRNFRHSICT